MIIANKNVKILLRSFFGKASSGFFVFLLCFANLNCLYAKSLPIWSELTEFEVSAINKLSAAERGEPDALLALYLLSSGDLRNQSDYLKILKHIDEWVETVRPEVLSETTDWDRGFRLHRMMHESFFLGGNIDENDGEGYDAEQSQLSEVFRSKKFNCVSASLLFTVLAHKFDYKTQGVMLPSHVFIELEIDKNKIVEVETTSAEGFDWVHDEEFYEESASQDWFDQRELAPSTYEDYQEREIISPYELGVQNMKNQHVRPGRMDYEDRMRLVELVSELDYKDVNSHKVRLGFYAREYARLRAIENYASLDEMYSRITPFLKRMETHSLRDSEIDNMLAWIQSQQVLAAIMNGRVDEGVTLAYQYIDQMNPAIDDFNKVVNNIYVALSKHVENLLEAKEFIKARQVFAGRENDCVLQAACVNAFRQIYSKWASSYWDSSDWPQVIAMYADFLNYESTGKAADLFKENMQSAFLNWSIEFIKTEDWLGASEVLKQCVIESPSSRRCQARLQKLKEQIELDS